MINKMFITPQEALSILEHYKYFLIFPITVIEGPIISIITGFLVFLGYLNVYVAYLVVVVADVLGDSMYYTIGRHWRKWTWVKKYAKYVGYSDESEQFIEEHFKKHTAKTLMIAKISHGIGAAVQISAGIARINFRVFLWYSVIGTMLKSFVLILIGYYLGQYYLKIDQYFHSFALFTLSVFVLLVVGYVVVKKYAGSFLKKEE